MQPEPAPGARRPRLRRALSAAAALLLTSGLVATASGAAVAAEDVSAAARVDNPYVGANVYVNPEWSARAAAEPGGTAVSNQPTFVWLDRRAAINGVNGGMGLRDHLDEAVRQQQQKGGEMVFQVVVYNLPGRDCAALASAGELGPNDLPIYKSEFIDPITQILSDPAYASLRIATIIEVDSLPNLVTNAGGTNTTTPQCEEMKRNGGYVNGIGYALNKLGDIPNVYNYVDVAHHGWLGWDSNFRPAAQLFYQAANAEGATPADVTGFISNTANYSALTEPHFKITDTVNGQTVRQSKWVDWNYYLDELSFVQAFRTELIAQGFPSSIGMLIDTSRNGWGGANRPTGPGPLTSVDAYVNGSRVDRRIHLGNWCNQAGAGLGERPTVAPAAGVDAYVWAKPPGESDGASEEIPNDEGKRFDRMCDPTYTGNARNNFNMSGALGGAPLSGQWFSAQFRELLANAYPPVNGGGNPNPGDTQAPTVPAGLTVTGKTSSSVTLSWTPSTDNVAVTGYDVYRGSTKVNTTPVVGTTFTDSGLSASTAYSYTVRARDAAGNVSAASVAVSVTTDAGGGNPGPTGNVKVQYRNADSSATDNAIRPHLRIANTGTSALNLSTVTARYYFTRDGASSVNVFCDWAQIGCSNIRTNVVNLSTPVNGADAYVEISFTSGSVAAGQNTGDIQLRINKSDWSAFNEANDYSYGTGTSFADAPKIPAYTSGTLAWGTAAA
ncbi:glycoside hydrolase family 6 protein [Allostreptomyces psammosilenae]|uniref:Glucanase n=1 Tax=Allostreptomyces psammosilenae TaxID=1892865 RepID=A0A852ZPL5_9ACTN|nr:glycoside hydrolase family 6 protein [Allostreptomyces psammosilenae]NYI03675.1 cellulose 1,4-beta-cellobiosidase [Allostreptomyces psammosilenae]